MAKRAPRPGEGRPTKYRPEMCAMADEYLATCKVDVENYVKTDGDRSTSYQRIIHVNLPKLEGFSEFLDVDHSTMLVWEKEHDEFSEALTKIRRAQHNMLVNGGVSGEFNPVITKLMLSSNHGYKEKSDVTSNDKPIQANTIIIKNFDDESSTDSK